MRTLMFAALWLPAVVAAAADKPADAPPPAEPAVKPAAKPSVAVVNLQKVAFESAAGKQLLEGWRTYIDGRRGEHEAKQEALLKVRNELDQNGKTLKAEQKQALEAKAAALQRELTALNTAVQAEQKKIQALAEQIQKEAERLLKEHCKAEGIAVVLDSGRLGGGEGPSPLIVVDESADITDALLKKMEGFKPTAPAPPPEFKLPAADPDDKDPAPTVVIETSAGDITVELDRAKAPGTVDNFLRYVAAKHYDGTVFHRVIKDFMIQGGGMTDKMVEKPTGAAIKNEANNGLKNLRGSIAMARTGEIDSATAQFYINHKDNPNLDHQPGDPDRFGYAVFGKVIKGLDVVDKIAAVKTGPRDVPVEPVVIKSARRLPAKDAPAPKPESPKPDTKKE
jgi:cyclophilin family peptidyl-prolyl cis-trans isomerase/Skp family chaperone for outer membrane proteins